MGKTKRNKKSRFGLLNGHSNSNANDPYSLLGDNFDEEAQNTPLNAVRDQLLNANVEEKLNGLQALAVLANNKEKTGEVCHTDIVRIASPMLCEKNNDPVRNAAAGALRNLSVCGGTDVCDFLVEQDILTPLIAVLDEYARDTHWTPSFDIAMGGQLDLHSDIFLQNINLLWNLCESSTIAIDAFNQTQLLESLIRYLDFNVFGMEIAISVGQCLLVISESNPKSWHIINQHMSVLLCLISLNGEPSRTYLRTLAAGILSNIPALSAGYLTSIFTSLAQTLGTQSNLLELVNSNCKEELDSNMSEIENMETMEGMEEETEEAARVRRRKQDLPTDSDIAARNMGYLLDAQRLAAETVTNLVTGEDEEWEDADSDDVSGNEDVLDGIENGNNYSGFLEQNKLPVEVVEIIKSSQLIEKIWDKAQPIEDCIVHRFRETNDTFLLTKAKNLRISSLLCLQNLYNGLTTDDLGGCNSIYNVWVNLGQQVFKGPNDVTILEPSTSLMRAALEHLKKNGDLFGQMSKSDLDLILKGVQNCIMAEIRANWLRMLGTLGCFLSEELAKEIVSFIVETCSQESDVWTISEALDGLMDIFGDNDWNQIIVDLNLAVCVKELEKIFKTKTRQQKRELKDRYVAVQTVMKNFIRFVKYIESETNKVKNG